VLDGEEHESVEVFNQHRFNELRRKVEIKSVVARGAFDDHGVFPLFPVRDGFSFPTWRAYNHRGLVSVRRPAFATVGPVRGSLCTELGGL
jgi:hypothetical protein